MNSEYTAEDMESFLPPEMGSSGSNKSIILLIAELLRTFTDEEHGLSVDEIRDVIELRTGKRPSENKVLDDIHELAENKPFGTSIEIPARGETKGFRCTKTFIASDQARLLINMVQTCKFITPDQRHDLCEALHGMVSYWQQDEIVESVCADERELPTHQDVFSAADIAYRAIREGKKLSFSYAQRDLYGNEFLIPNGERGYVFEETPIALVFSFGNYYVETWEEERGKRFARRLDKIRDAKVSNADALIDENVQRLRDTVQERLSQTFDMWGDDRPRTLFLRVKGRGIGYTYDRFGPSIKFRNVDQLEESGYLCVSIQLGPTFYRWLFGMRGLVTIEKPVSTMWVSQFVEDNQDVTKPFDELVADFERALYGFWEHLKLTCSALGFGIEDAS